MTTTYEITRIDAGLGQVYWNQWTDGVKANSGWSYNQAMPAGNRWTLDPAIAKTYNIPMSNPDLTVPPGPKDNSGIIIGLVALGLLALFMSKK